MIPVDEWFANIHPHAPLDQVEATLEIISDLKIGYQKLLGTKQYLYSPMLGLRVNTQDCILRYCHKSKVMGIGIYV